MGVDDVVFMDVHSAAREDQTVHTHNNYTTVLPVTLPNVVEVERRDPRQHVRGQDGHVNHVRARRRG
jgi:hypothetical protein